MSQKTLQQYFADSAARGVIDHAVRACVDSSGITTFYIHPANADGDTLDFAVDGNELLPVGGGADEAFCAE